MFNLMPIINEEEGSEAFLLHCSKTDQKINNILGKGDAISGAGLLAKG